MSRLHFPIAPTIGPREARPDGGAPASPSVSFVSSVAPFFEIRYLQRNPVLSLSLSLSLSDSFFHELVPELLDGFDRVGEHRHLFAQTPDVHVDRPRTAGVLIAPH